MTGSLFLQSLKQSEDGRSVILRLTEQDGRRGELKLPFPARLLTLTEDEAGETDTLAYGPFEIVTAALTPEQARAWLFG